MKANARHIAIAIVPIVLVLVFLQYRRSMGILWDVWSEKRLFSLHPAIRKDVRRFINHAEDEGILLRITSGTRSMDEQTALYNQGRTTPGKIVTNAKAGQSYHNYGLAFDVVEIAKGQGLWENPRWEEIGRMGESFGFDWGGRWRSPDRPHFHKTFGLSTAQLKNRLDAGNGEYVNIT